MKWRTGLMWPVAVIMAVLVANLPILAGIVTVNPLGLSARIQAGGEAGFLPGRLYTDPHLGYPAPALVHLAAGSSKALVPAMRNATRSGWATPAPQ